MIEVGPKLAHLDNNVGIEQSRRREAGQGCRNEPATETDRIDVSGGASRDETPTERYGREIPCGTDPPKNECPPRKELRLWPFAVG